MLIQFRFLCKVASVFQVDSQFNTGDINRQAVHELLLLFYAHVLFTDNH